MWFSLIWWPCKRLSYLNTLQMNEYAPDAWQDLETDAEDRVGYFFHTA